MKKNIINPLLLVLTALIWGAAFVAQSTGGDAVGPFSFNCIRCIIGGLVLLPVIAVFDRLNLSPKKPVGKNKKKYLYKGGIICGIVFSLASNIQQLGITLGAEVGKAGFLTACYIIFVPLIGLFFKKRCGINIWIGVILTLVGLYLLCINGSFSISLPDLLLILCAVLFSFHILFIDKYAADADPIRMSCIQFFTCAVLSAIPMIISEVGFSHDGLINWLEPLKTPAAWTAILYAGVCSCGIAYTLQLVAQPKVNPTAASLILSLESVFSAIAGWILLNQRLTPRAIAGCVLIFAAVVLAQIPVKRK